MTTNKEAVLTPAELSTFIDSHYGQHGGGPLSIESMLRDFERTVVARIQPAASEPLKLHAVYGNRNGVQHQLEILGHSLTSDGIDVYVDLPTPTEAAPTIRDFLIVGGEAGAVPAGYQLVPEKPSIAACIRGAAAVDNIINGHAAAQVYAAMLHSMRHTAPPSAPAAAPIGWVDDGGTVFWKDQPPPDGSDLYVTLPYSSAESITDADINGLTLEKLGQWPSFEAQSWACKIAHAVIDNWRDGPAFAALPAESAQPAAADLPKWIIVNEPGMVPDLKGPLIDRKHTEQMLRGLYSLNPAFTCTLVRMPRDSYPQSGREWLSMHGDRRRKALPTAATADAQATTVKQSLSVAQGDERAAFDVAWALRAYVIGNVEKNSAEGWFKEGWNAALSRQPSAPEGAWSPIQTMDLSDELVWLRKGNSIDGPREAATDDYDRYGEWAPCNPPSDRQKRARDGAEYGPYRVKWIGAGVWAGITDELPGELEGQDVYLRAALAAAKPTEAQFMEAATIAGYMGANAMADALTAKPTCPHADDPRGCYRVRCQLGKVCVDAAAKPEGGAA